MAEYTQLRNDVWQDSEFETLPPSAKLLWLNLLTTPARNTAGLFHYSVGRMSFETGLSRDDTAAALASLVGLKWVEYDDPTGVVWVCNFVKKQPCGPTMIPKIKKDLEEGFESEHPLVKRFRIRYVHLYSDPQYPTDTQPIPDRYPPSTQPIGPARKHSTAQHSNSTEEKMAGLASVEIQSESKEGDYQTVIGRALKRGMGAKQVEGIIYQLADWWPTRPAKAQKRNEAHKTLQQWLIREEPKADPIAPGDATYPDLQVPEYWK